VDQRYRGARVEFAGIALAGNQTVADLQAVGAVLLPADREKATHDAVAVQDVLAVQIRLAVQAAEALLRLIVANVLGLRHDRSISLLTTRDGGGGAARTDTEVVVHVHSVFMGLWCLASQQKSRAYGARAPCRVSTCREPIISPAHNSIHLAAKLHRLDAPGPAPATRPCPPARA
jgi:hypothetical protein